MPYPPAFLAPRLVRIAPRSIARQPALRAARPTAALPGRRVSPAACAAPPVDNDTAAAEAPQGPAAPAPTAAGVSTAGLEPRDAALLEACYAADIAAIEAAIDAGGSALARDLNRRSALHFCAGNGLVGIVKRLVEVGGAEVDAQDMLGLTPLHMATGYKKAGTVRCLVELGADANIACYGGELPVELAERLLEGTPKRKMLMPNAEWAVVKEIVDVLDEATEVEEAEDEEEVVVAMEEREEQMVVGSAGARLKPGEEEASEAGGATFKVRIKAKAPEVVAAVPPAVVAMPPQATSPGAVAADVKVTVRKRGEGAAPPPLAPAAGDVHLVVRRPGENKI